MRASLSLTMVILVLPTACMQALEGGGGDRELPGPGAPILVEAEPQQGHPGDPEASTRAEEDSDPGEGSPAVFEPATRGSGACEVTVRALLDAEEYRGAGPMTPALEAQLASDPGYAQMWEAESHGDYHIQCHYEVGLGHEPGNRYRWRVVFSNTLRDRSPEDCKTGVGEVALDIIRTTKECTDPSAGAYYGETLELL